MGARTLVYGVGAPRESHGKYLPDCKTTAPKGLGCGEDSVELRRRVWEELSEKLENIQPGVIKRILCREH